MINVNEFLNTTKYEDPENAIISFLHKAFNCELIDIDKGDNTIFLTNTKDIDHFIQKDINFDLLDKIDKSIRIFKRFIRKGENNNSPYNGLFIFVYSGATNYLCRIGQIYDNPEDKKIEVNYTSPSDLKILKDILNELY